MNKFLLAATCLAASVPLSGCSTAFWGGAAGGAVGAGAGYEVNARTQLQRLEDDYKAGRIDQKEYEIRKDQIRRDSMLQ